MRVLDTATILAAMAQVSSRKPRGDRGPAERTPAAARVSRLVVVPQGVIPVIVMSTRLAAASRARFRAAS